MNDELFEELRGLTLDHDSEDISRNVVMDHEGQIWSKFTGSVDIHESQRDWFRVPWAYRTDERITEDERVTEIIRESLPVYGTPNYVYIVSNINWMYFEWIGLLKRRELEQAHGELYGSTAMQNGAL